MLSPRQAAELLERHGLAPRRALGQHFLVDPNTIRRIARLAEVGPGDHVVEIGPGLGSLTLALAATGARITAVEADRGLVPVLQEVLEAYPGITVVTGDARHQDWTALLGPGPAVLCANLPYNIATGLVADLLDEVPAIVRMCVMVQLEVAERLVARPRTKAYGAVSVKVAFHASGTIAARVPPTVFLPPPKVDSAVVVLRRHDRPLAPDLDRSALFALVRTGFGQRRKMLRRSLAGVVDPATFAAAGVAPEARPEELDVTAWIALARAHLAATHPTGG